MPIELRKVRDRDFQSFFKVALVDKPDEPVGEILSEGEHRCVALASFLAELVTSKDYSGIVFDDPMSSLDHNYRRRVAKRLVEEAAHRQVIVFTHDLTFLFDLQREAEAARQNVHYQNVHRARSRPGHISDDLPIDAKSAGPLAAALRSELKQVRGDFDKWSEARRSVFADGFIGKLRKAWEQGIADLIQPVVSRFNSGRRSTSLRSSTTMTSFIVYRPTRRSCAGWPRPPACRHRRAPSWPASAGTKGRARGRLGDPSVVGVTVQEPMPATRRPLSLACSDSPVNTIVNVRNMQYISDTQSRVVSEGHVSK